jgi:hypothetical protein
MTTKTVKTKTITITSCMGCPHMRNRTAPQGNRNIECWHPSKLRVISFGTIEYPDEIGGKMIAQDCERPSEYPKTFPRWCPL